MDLVLFDQEAQRNALLPLTYTRPIATLRVGILTIAEKWAKALGQEASFLTADYLKAKYPMAPATVGAWFINGGLCPNAALLEALEQLPNGHALQHQGTLLALKASAQQAKSFAAGAPLAAVAINSEEFTAPYTLIAHPWDIFRQNGAQLRADFEVVTLGRESAPITDPFTRIYSPENVFVEEGAEVRAALLNAENGPIYLGKDSRIHENATIKGPFALCEGAHVNMGGKVRGDSTIGPYSKVGGEVSNSVVIGYSNKGHEGFMGNSVLGEWCNLGADTNTSNLKNNYSAVKVWNDAAGDFVDTGLQFCGLIMGDHAKCGINTMFNTGTVVGTGANVFGGGFPQKNIPAFGWGGAEGFTTFHLGKVYQVAERVMKRRNIELTEADKEIIKHIFTTTEVFRK